MNMSSTYTCENDILHNIQGGLPQANTGYREEGMRRSMHIDKKDNKNQPNQILFGLDVRSQNQQQVSKKRASQSMF